MKKTVLALAAFAALSTSAFAWTAEEFRVLENPQNQSVWGQDFTSMSSPVTVEEGFAVPASGDGDAGDSAYRKSIRLRMMENPEHY